MPLALALRPPAQGGPFVMCSRESSQLHGGRSRTTHTTPSHPRVSHKMAPSLPPVGQSHCKGHTARAYNYHDVSRGAPRAKTAADRLVSVPPPLHHGDRLPAL